MPDSTDPLVPRAIQPRPRSFDLVEGADLEAGIAELAGYAMLNREDMTLFDADGAKHTAPHEALRAQIVTEKAP